MAKPTTTLRPASEWVAPTLAGVDFTSRPRPAKPITVALGVLDVTDATAASESFRAVRLERVETHPTAASFLDWLHRPGPWLGAFDFPFGLPRELVEALGWPTEWPALMRHYASLPRDEIRAAFRAFCAARPTGGKFAHRACDATSGASPSMKWVNPPVAFMLHAGASALLDAGVHLPGLHEGDRSRVALEGYPGLLAREFVGRRSYKSDDRRANTASRREAREEIVDALCHGRGRLAVRLVLGGAERASLVEEPSADKLDAVLCLVQAAWASAQPGYGLPACVDALEGWIVSAPLKATATAPPATPPAPARR